MDTFLSWPCGLAIDYHNERLYWADAKSHTVETAKYDGSDRHIVRTFDSKYLHTVLFILMKVNV